MAKNYHPPFLRMNQWWICGFQTSVGWLCTQVVSIRDPKCDHLLQLLLMWFPRRFGKYQYGRSKCEAVYIYTHIVSICIHCDCFLPMSSLLFLALLFSQCFFMIGIYIYYISLPPVLRSWSLATSLAQMDTSEAEQVLSALQALRTKGLQRAVGKSSYHHCR